MDPARIGLFALAEQRLAWTTQRQALLARNIANASTPAFQPRDLRPFTDTLARLGGVTPARTDPSHLTGTTASTALAARPKARAPDGNAVAIDEQLTKVADTQSAQALTTTLYKRYMAMFAMALGRNA